mmetsp:Transcript_6504/g.16138  ORF Transcript_6504/g.16138 Transcript_6504/m.16138 type:complete len:635 (-) Transcript_6504:356-2260(-)
MAGHGPQYFELKGSHYLVKDSRLLNKGYDKLIVGWGGRRRKVIVFGSDRRSASKFECNVLGDDKNAYASKVDEEDGSGAEFLSSGFVGEEKHQCHPTGGDSQIPTLHAIFARCPHTLRNTNEFVAVTKVEARGSEEVWTVQGFHTVGDRTFWEGHNEEGYHASGAYQMALFAIQSPRPPPSADHPPQPGAPLQHNKAFLAISQEGQAMRLDEIDPDNSRGYTLDGLTIPIAGRVFEAGDFRRQSKLAKEISSMAAVEGQDATEDSHPEYSSSFYWTTDDEKTAIVIRDFQGGRAGDKECHLALGERHEGDIRVTMLQNENLRGRGWNIRHPVDKDLEEQDGYSQGGGSSEEAAMGGGHGGGGVEEEVEMLDVEAEDEGTNRVNRQEIVQMLSRNEAEGGKEALVVDSEGARRSINAEEIIYRVNTLGTEKIEFFNDLSVNFEQHLADPLSLDIDDKHNIFLALALRGNPFKSLQRRFENAVKYLNVIQYRRAKNPLQAVLNLDDGDKICSEFRQKVRPTWYCRAWRDLDQAVRTCEIQRMELVKGCRYGLSFIEEEATFVTDDEKEAAGDAWRYLEGNVRLPIVDNEKGKDLLETLFETAEMYAEDALEQPGESETKSQAEHFLSFMKTFSARL